jgi:hypothetical protein
VDEPNTSTNGYVEPDQVVTGFFKTLIEKVDTNDSKELEASEIRAAQRDPALQSTLGKIIGGHPSEWHSSTQQNIKTLFETKKATCTDTAHKNLLDFEKSRLQSCEFMSQVPLAQKVWHFHSPILIDSLTNNKYIDRHPKVLCTRYNNTYGPVVFGTVKIDSEEVNIHWNELIDTNVITEKEKNIICKMSVNEGNLDAVQSYDSEIITAGAMQKTVPVGVSSGELSIQVEKFRSKNPDEYQELFVEYGWFLDSSKLVYQSQSFSEGEKLTNKDLKAGLRNMCSSDNFKKTIDCKPIYDLSNSISQPIFIKQQLLDFIDRLHLICKLKVNDLEVEDIFKSELGLATALDHHVNRPSNVISHIKKAIKDLHKEHPNISEDVSTWGSSHSDNENKLIDIYGCSRTDMTDGANRFEKLKEAFK